ncbi:NAD-dependent epimerase/dehydratase family protein [Zwartia panacis]|uniref:NAD-dependent epimerase/dehydratase family protein n=1 Tax=Zwartia panacis TaxID=2683345 RepID=UPI0025B3E5C8|nr:NAD-dependent epimerase/dehydratase family protein [Zwartia panacis]MDN4018061.1 NAD-dependent epimerase/dehydratase family protein [Zwartia panacis]
MKLLITGATGYIGQRLVRAAKEGGHQVVTTGRSSTKVIFDLSNPQPLKLDESFDAVFHLAAVTSSSTSNPEAEINAAQYLFQAAVQQDARIIFVSSQVSREDAPTDYGRTKWLIEQLAIASNGYVLRPGQVYGGFESGLFGVLATLVRKLPAYPAFLPAPRIQPVHVDDLVAALLSCATTKGLESAILSIGAEQPVSFTGFLRGIQRYWVRRFRIPVPVPVGLVRLAINLIGHNLRTKLGLERLISLFDLKPMETRADLQRLGIQLRMLESGLHRSGYSIKRDLALEGHGLLRYVLGVRPTQGLIRKYVRCVELLRHGRSLKLKPYYLRWTSLLHLIDTSKTAKSTDIQEFVWRLNAAVVIAEASTLGAKRLLGLGQSYGFLSSSINIAIAVLQEASWRLLRMLAAPFIRNPFGHKAIDEDQA